MESEQDYLAINLMNSHGTTWDGPSSNSKSLTSLENSLYLIQNLRKELKHQYDKFYCMQLLSSSSIHQNMSSLYEEMARKRNREEEPLKMAGKSPKKAPNFKGVDDGCLKTLPSNSSSALKTRNWVQNKGKEEVSVGKVEEEEKKKKKMMMMRDGGDFTVGEKSLEWAMGFGSDEWPSICSTVMEEQMCWGSVWFPVLDEEGFKGGFCGQNEVLWEDDIWHLRDIKEIPNPSTKSNIL